MGGAAVPAERNCAVEGGGQRRHDCSGLDAPTMDGAGTCADRSREGFGQGFRHGLRAVPRCVQPSGRSARSASCAIPGAPQRAVDRSCPRPAVPGGVSETRALELHAVSPALREAWPVERKLAGHTTRDTAVLPRVREGNGGDRATRGRRASSRSLRRRLPDAYVADLFSGSGGVAQHARRQGFKAKEFDIRHGKGGDLLAPGFRRNFARDMQEGKVIAVMIATPCSSFSLAQSRGGKALRSRLYPRGIPQFLTERERSRIEIGNRCLDVTIFVIRLCNKCNVPWMLENPSSSYLWCDKTLQRHVNAYADIHQCAFGAHWRKATRFGFGNISSEQIQKFQDPCCRCHGKHGYCSFRPSHKHIQLNGSAMTRAAAKYPPRLSRIIASTLIS
jgi:hypothetical protein